jgi:hypothetical protein
MLLDTTALHMSIGKDMSLTHPIVADKAWLCDEQRVQMEYQQHNPIVL